MARIWYQSFVHPIEQAPYIDRLQAMLSKVASPGMNFEVHGLDPDAHARRDVLRQAGGRVVRTAVGDRNVIDEMLRHGFNLGGEQSGHLIFRDFGTTGDGLVSAFRFLKTDFTLSVRAEAVQPQIEAVVRSVPGTLSAIAERTVGGSYLDIDIDRRAVLRLYRVLDWDELLGV